MRNGLINLYKENSSTLSPDPWYAWYHYSHPTLFERVKNLETLIGMPDEYYDSVSDLSVISECSSSIQ